jgi:TM2 domain-containing membrane protein YozV
LQDPVKLLNFSFLALISRQMKKLYLIIICLLTLSCAIVDAQYKINKSRYDYHRYIYQPGDPYNPGSAGVASLIIPGLGQMISGEPGRGLGFFTGCTGFLALSVVGGIINGNAHEGDMDGIPLLLAGLAGAGITWICSIPDAMRVAKVNNLAFRAKYNSNVSLKVLPYSDIIDPYGFITANPVGITIIILF